MFKSTETNETDSEKIEKLYYKYRNLMYKIAYSILNDSQLSEDAVQQSFVKLMSKLDKIDMKNEDRTRGFLSIICRNTAIDIYKKRSYLNQNSNSLDYEIDDDEDAPLDYVEPSKIVIDRETVDIIAKAIEDLPEIYKDILLLEKIHGNSKEEIAELLSLNYETVKKRSLRARKMLADALTKEELK